MDSPGNGSDGDKADGSKIWKKPAKQPKGCLTVPLYSDVYGMDPEKRGRCLIFNNKTFKKCLKLDERTGTDLDADALEEVFTRFGFKPERFDNRGANDIKSILKKAGKEKHHNRDCFVCCILTHGTEDSLYAEDGLYSREKIFKPFDGEECTSLAGKPKMFFIQACYGKKPDHGVKVETYDSVGACTIPAQADFFVAYCSTPGYLSWRSGNKGSWFIQSLCDVFRSSSENMHLLDIMTLVNLKVGIKFESSHEDEELNNSKQAPCMASSLTRKVFFTSKS